MKSSLLHQKAGKDVNPRGGLPLGPNMTRHVHWRNELLDRLSNPTEFLLRRWVTTVVILGVIVILLVATLAMLV